MSDVPTETSEHVCERCHRRFETTRGLGLHISQRHPGTVQLITCRACRSRVRLLAKGMCRTCYDKARCAPRACRDCGEVRRHQGSGRCTRCHRQASTKASSTCSECLAWGQLIGGRCAACRQLRTRNIVGVCPWCRREVSIGRDGRCRLCSIAHRASGSKEGICSDCELWTPLIASGLCNSCLVFRFRGEVGACSVCHRQVVVGKLGRCRRCMVAGARAGERYPGRPMQRDQLEAGLVPTLASEGIQLFFADMRNANRWPPTSGQEKQLGRQPPPRHDGPQTCITPGQLRLLWLPADVSMIDVEEVVRAAAIELPDLFTSVGAFGELRGWSEVTVRQVQRATAVLLAARCDETFFDPSVLEHLGALDLPLNPTLDFVSDTGLLTVNPEARLDAWLEERLHSLPEQIRDEVLLWVEVLRGRSKRRGRSYRSNTIKAYVRACRPALDEWSCRYDSCARSPPRTSNHSWRALRDGTGPTSSSGCDPCFERSRRAGVSSSTRLRAMRCKHLPHDLLLASIRPCEVRSLIESTAQTTG